MAVVFPAALLFLVVYCQGIEAATWVRERPQIPFGEETRIGSPNGRLELLWKEDQISKDHQIWIRRVGNKEEERLLYSFMRGADVLWSPNSKMVAITDAYGSNVSVVIVFRVYPDGQVRVIGGVKEQIDRFLRDGTGRRLFSHTYAETVRWSLDSRRLQVKLHALHPLDGSSQTLDKLITVKIPASED